MSNSRLGISITLFICVIMIGIIFAAKENEEKEDTPAPLVGSTQEEKEASEEIITGPFYDFDNPPPNVLNESQITTVTVPVAKQDLQYIPWEYYSGLELAVEDCELSKEIKNGFTMSDLPHYWPEIHAKGERTYLYLRVWVRNVTQEPIDLENTTSVGLLTLGKGDTNFGLSGKFLHDRDALDPPPGLSDPELRHWMATVQTCKTINPGEEQECFFMYAVRDVYLTDDMVPAVQLNGGYGPMEKHRWRAIRILFEQGGENEQ